MTSPVTILCICLAILAAGWASLRLRQSRTARVDPSLKPDFQHPAAKSARFGHVQKFRGHDESKAVAAAKRVAKHEVARRKLAAQAAKPRIQAPKKVESLRRMVG